MNIVKNNSKHIDMYDCDFLKLVASKNKMQLILDEAYETEFKINSYDKLYIDVVLSLNPVHLSIKEWGADGSTYSTGFVLRGNPITPNIRTGIEKCEDLLLDAGIDVFNNELKITIFMSKTTKPQIEIYYYNQIINENTLNVLNLILNSKFNNHIFKLYKPDIEKTRFHDDNCVLNYQYTLKIHNHVYIDVYHQTYESRNIKEDYFFNSHSTNEHVLFIESYHDISDTFWIATYLKNPFCLVRSENKDYILSNSDVKMIANLLRI